MGKDPGLLPERYQNHRQDIEDVFRYSTERISCCEKLNRMGSKGTLRLAQEALYTSKFRIKVERT